MIAEKNNFGVSVIVCTYNGASRIRSTLEYLFRQQNIDKYSWELIVVDNNSNDNTLEVVKDILRANEKVFNCKVLVEQKQGKNFAALCGLQSSQFPWVLICDDDNHLSSDYLFRGLEIIRGKVNIGALGGCGKPVFEGNTPQWFSTYAHSFAVGPQASKDGKIEKMPSELYGAGTFFRKKALLTFYENGFNGIMSCRSGSKLSSGGDTEWCFLIQLAGYDIWYSNSLQFDHLMPANRLNWQYYLKLKEGITSGAAKLFSYKLFFRNRNPSFYSFFYCYLAEFLNASFLYLYFKTRKTIQPGYYSKELKELGEVVLRAKFCSYLNDFRISASHFKQLKKTILLIG